jgi:hypothetical protein
VGDEKGMQKQRTAIAAFRERFKGLQLLLHEEKSLTSSETVYHMHQCFRAAFPENGNLPYAGFNVIFRLTLI